MTAAVHSFVLDHDYAWADGLICGGRMVVIAQPCAGPEPLRYFRSVARFLEDGRGFTEAVVLRTERRGGATGRRDSCLTARARRGRACRRETFPRASAARIAKPSSRPKPSVHDGVAFLPSWPRIRLIVVGAGHVGQAVAELAAQADFDVWVVDDRAQYANRERFPAAQRILVGPDRRGHPDPRDHAATAYALIVTRGHGHDQEALYHLAPTAAAYVGLIGSRRKIRLIFENLREAGIREADLERVDRAGRAGYRLADGARDRDQHRRRADRPAEPRPSGGRAGSRREAPSDEAMPCERAMPARAVRHDRRDCSRRRTQRADGTAQNAAADRRARR